MLETSLLRAAGMEVYVLTFRGILDKEQPPAKVHYRVLPEGTASRSLNSALGSRGGNLLAKWLVMFVEAFWTLLKAVRLKRKLACNVIFLRDGEPFVFLPCLLSIFFKDLNWCICLVSNPESYIVSSKSAAGIRRRVGFALLDRLVNSRLWLPIYRGSQRQARFVFLTLNEETKAAYERYQSGVFRGKVAYVPLPTAGPISEVSKESAREQLGLPKRKPLLLSFGAIHSGKDLKVVLEAIEAVPDVLLVHAGEIQPWLDPGLNGPRKDLSGKVVIKNHYILEGDKKYYFFAADAVVLSYKRNFTQSVSLLWEACRFRTPVIASNCGQLGELVRAFDLGLPFEPQDASSLREAIRSFLALSPERKGEMGKNWKKFSSAYPVTKWTHKVAEIFGTLTAPR